MRIYTDQTKIEFSELKSPQATRPTTVATATRRGERVCFSRLKHKVFSAVLALATVARFNRG